MSISKTVVASMQSFGLSPASPVYLAISGGVDSVVLAHVLKEAGYSVTWLHMNFQLRGDESDRDQRFVESLAGQWNQSLQVKRVDAATYASENKLSIQEAARALRYDWFSEMTSGHGGVLLTAHHADDNAETLLMNFLRGTGLKGLTGIPPVNGSIRRPLLNVTRAAIEAYAIENGIEFVTDSSNKHTDYTRNQLRLEVLPMLRTLYMQVDGNLQQNIHRFQSAYLIYRQAVQRWLRKYVQLQGEEQSVSIALLMQAENRAMVHEWLSGFGFTEKQESELIRLAGSESGHFIVSADGRYRVIRHRKHFILSPVRDAQPEEQWIEAGAKEVTFSNGLLQFNESGDGSYSDTASGSQAALDAGMITYPLLLRKWRAGDYFYPLGLNKKKKVARFLIDQKLSVSEKEQVWVLVSEGRIAWVIGQRIDHRFRVTDRTRATLHIELSR
ncbi:MAG: tRNA lysidine(34) synthetase TilS [Bacteroidota bacterium]